MEDGALTFTELATVEGAVPAVRVNTPAPDPEAMKAGAVCAAVHVFAWARFNEPTTAPVVGENVMVPSEFETEVTAPPPTQPGLKSPTLPVESTPRKFAQVRPVCNPVICT